MSETTFDLGDVERLTATLDAKCADLDEEDRATLHAVFALAGKAVVGGNEDEVSGFASSQQAIIFVGGITSGGLFDSFCQWGVGRQESTLAPVQPDPTIVEP